MAMAHIRSIGSLLSIHGNNQNNIPNNEDIVKKGYLAKQKNMKNRFFVLRRETSKDHPARLEYYDSENKFLEGCQPKKKYILKECFNISRKTDKNNFFVFALYYSNKDCIALVTESEAELQEWLQSLQHHKNSGGEHSEAKHVWLVEVLPRSLASPQNLTGDHWLCLTDRLLSLVRVNNFSIKSEFQLNTIKKCGFLDQFFFFQLGRYSGIGCGELYMQTEDSFIAQCIHNFVSRAMNNFRRTTSTLESDIRKRTSSDPQSVVPPTKLIERCESVPNNPRNHPIKMGLCPSIEKIQQQQDFIDGKHFASFSEEDRGQLTPEKESVDFDEEFPPYLLMEPLKGEFIPPIINSPRGLLGDFEGSSEDGVYVPMDSGGERQPPNTLGVSPRVIPTSHSGIVSPVGSNACNPQGVSTPVSPSIGGVQFWGSGSLGTQLQSPQTSTGSHSRNPFLLDDAYVPMLSPGTQGPQLSQGQSEESSPYLKMGPGPSMTAGGAERRRTISTPTPIPLSPSDDSCCEMYGNSGSSSCTSGTPSDQRIHDIAGEERCATPHSGMWGNYSPNYNGDDPDCLGEPRPIRTNSVGSKSDQFKKKNRLDAAVPSGEPARVRAFSLGSRVSLKFGVGRHGATGAHQGAEHPSGGLGDMFPSIKECGKQVKSKSSSAPMLGSHSWSGTPGCYFRGFIQCRNTPRETNLMELDFRKNKNSDVLPSEDKETERDRKTSKERLWHTFTGHRHRSNSKSSGSSNTKLGGESWGSKEKRTSESDASSRGVEIPHLDGNGDGGDYLKLDFTQSPRSSAGDPMKGYLPMHPPSFLSSSLTNAGEFLTEKRGPRTSSLNEAYLEMSSSRSSCASQDGYVDMTQGGSSGLTIASSSSSSNSINVPPSGGRSRRTSNIYAPVMSSQELPSPMEDLGMDEEIGINFGEGFRGESRKKGKKGSKRKSLRDSAKKKKSENSMMGGESPEFPHKTKTPGPLATLTSLISRKPNNNNNNPKAPLSPKGSPLPPKGSKESTSPFSSLTRTKSKDKESVRGVGEDKERTSLSGDVYNPPVTPSSPLSISPQCSMRRRTLDTIDMSPPPQIYLHKSEEKMLFSPLEASKLRRQPSKTEADTEKRRSAYMNLDVSKESTSGSLPSLNIIQKASSKPTNYLETRNYVNMQPGTSSPQLWPHARDNSSPRSSHSDVVSPQTTSHSTKPPPQQEENYVMMGGGGDAKEPRAPSFPSEVVKRPEIPHKLLSSHSHPPSLALEKLSLKEDKLSGTSSERSRSHSGPGTSDGMKGLKKAEDGRAASACSSPVSYSPPTSPTLGSVSSMSSLSEGGLSSASSTCTVVNVGVKNSAGTTSIAPKVTLPHPLVEPPVPSSDAEEVQPPPSSDKSAVEDGTLNYVALDLGTANSSNKNSKTSSPRMTPKTGVTKPSSGDEAPLSYVQIDFKKSEGLRNTSIARDSKRPH